jgi:hypothetical protein
MIRGARARLLCCAWLLSACSSGGGSETLIGATCHNSDECDVAGTCVTDGPDGICTQSCRVPGGAQECPLNSYCDRAELTSDTAAKSEMTLCLPACKAQGDCRDGYSCSGVSGGPGKVCRPE